MDKIAAVAVAVGSLGYALASKQGTPVSSVGATRLKSFVRKLYREVWNEQDTNKASKEAKKYISEDHILIDPSHPSPAPGVEPYMEGVRSIRGALSEFSISIDDLIAQGSKVVAQLSYKAFHNGKEARWTGTAVMEIEDDKVVKTWINSDSISALIQLGLLQDVVGGQFARQVARTSTSGTNMRISDNNMDIVYALLGRTEAHPTQVLTGNEWLSYFETANDAAGINTGDKAVQDMMRVDSKTGLDHVV